MQSFSTATQYDEQFKDIGEFKNQRSACSLFSLQTASCFMKNGITNKDTHDINLMVGILNHIEKQINSQITFENLLENCSLSKDTICTSVDLVREKVLGFESMFKPENYSKAYCIIFLKNSKFFNVLYSPQAKYKYSIRDCHEIDQYDFTNQSDIIEHLNKVYSFSHVMEVGGMTLHEFSSIEFKIIEDKFENYFKINAVDLGAEPEATEWDTNLNIDVEDSIFDSNIDSNIKNNYIESLSDSKRDMKIAMKLQEEEFKKTDSNKYNSNTVDDELMALRLQEDEFKGNK